MIFLGAVPWTEKMFAASDVVYFELEGKGGGGEVGWVTIFTFDVGQ